MTGHLSCEATVSMQNGRAVKTDYTVYNTHLSGQARRYTARSPAFYSHSTSRCWSNSNWQHSSQLITIRIQLVILLTSSRSEYNSSFFSPHHDLNTTRHSSHLITIRIQLVILLTSSRSEYNSSIRRWVRMLMDRYDKIVSEEVDRHKEKETIKEALKVCGYPQWAIITSV